MLALRRNCTLLALLVLPVPTFAQNTALQQKVIGTWNCRNNGMEITLQVAANGTEVAQWKTPIGGGSHEGRYSIVGNTLVSPLHDPGRLEGDSLILGAPGQMWTCTKAVGTQEAAPARLLPFQPKPSRPDVEARELAAEYWNRQYRKCGEFYFTGSGPNFRAANQLRGCNEIKCAESQCRLGCSV